MDHGHAGAATGPLLDQTRSAVERVTTVSARLQAFLTRVNGAPPTSASGIGERPAAALAPAPVSTPPYRLVLSDLHDEIGGLEALLGDLEQIG